MNAIVLVDKNWGIGIGGTQMKFNKEDLKNFNKMTTGNTVVMGYTTFISLPHGPLKERRNVVFYDKGEPIDGAIVVNSLAQFMDMRDELGEIFVCGGQSIYNLLLPYCRYAYVTKLHDGYEVDTYFPNLDERPCWQCVEVEEGKFGQGTSFCTYENICLVDIE
jgi:dihydrofolate reductase